MCDNLPVIQNDGDVIGSEQYGISSGNVGDNSTVNQSISRTTNMQYNMSYASYDEHNVTSYWQSDEYNTTVYTDSHDTTNNVSNSYSAVSNSYTNVDSHDTYTSTSYDSHDVTNINASFTSSGQAAIFGMFFGRGEAALVAIAVMAMAVIYFINTILAMLDIVAVTLLVVLAGYSALRHLQNKSAVNAYQEQQEAQRVMLAEQREHELRLAELSRPVYLTVRNEHGYSIEQASPLMLEDNHFESIELPAEKVLVNVRRQNARSR